MSDKLSAYISRLHIQIGVVMFFLLFLMAEVRTASAATIVVELKSNTSTAAFGDLINSTGVIVVRRYRDYKMYVLRVPAGTSVAELVTEYENSGLVESAEPNSRGKGGDGVVSFNDTYYSAQWHTKNVGKYSGVSGADIDAEAGWALTTGSRNIVVAILDTGLQKDHPEFIGRLVPGYDFVNDDDDPEADHPHGTHVSAILAANANNHFGTVGIDHHTLLMPLKVLDSTNSGYTSDLAAAIRYAADNYADVINMSLVGFKKRKVLTKAIKYARKKGVIMIACAGNDGEGTADPSYKWSYPGAYKQTISVGLTNHRDQRVSYSSTGPSLDVVAPGFFVPTAVHKGDPAPMNPDDEINGFGDYIAGFEGCSASTPVVSGIVSLMLSINPNLQYKKIRRILRNTAEDQVGPVDEDVLGRDDYFGWGRVNMGAALRRAYMTIGVN